MLFQFQANVSHPAWSLVLARSQSPTPHQAYIILYTCSISTPLFDHFKRPNHPRCPTSYTYILYLTHHPKGGTMNLKVGGGQCVGRWGGVKTVKTLKFEEWGGAWSVAAPGIWKCVCLISIFFPPRPFPPPEAKFFGMYAEHTQKNKFDACLA